MDILIPDGGVVSTTETVLVPGVGEIQVEEAAPTGKAPTATIYGPFHGPLGGPF